MQSIYKILLTIAVMFTAATAHAVPVSYTESQAQTLQAAEHSPF